MGSSGGTGPRPDDADATDLDLEDAPTEEIARSVEPNESSMEADARRAAAAPDDVEAMGEHGECVGDATGEKEVVVMSFRG